MTSRLSRIAGQWTWRAWSAYRTNIQQLTPQGFSAASSQPISGTCGPLSLSGRTRSRCRAQSGGGGGKVLRSIALSRSKNRFNAFQTMRCLLAGALAGTGEVAATRVCPPPDHGCLAICARQNAFCERQNALLLPQQHQGVEPRGSTGGDPCCGQGRERQEHEHHRPCHRITGRDPTGAIRASGRAMRRRPCRAPVQFP